MKRHWIIKIILLLFTELVTLNVFSQPIINPISPGYDFKTSYEMMEVYRGIIFQTTDINYSLNTNSKTKTGVIVSDYMRMHMGAPDYKDSNKMPTIYTLQYTQGPFCDFEDYINRKRKLRFDFSVK